MVKQKLVIRLSMEDQQKRTKALQAAVTMDGVNSVSIDGDKIVIEGDGIDSSILTTVLREKVGFAELISVTSGDEKKKEEQSGGDSKTE